MTGPNEPSSLPPVSEEPGEAPQSSAKTGNSYTILLVIGGLIAAFFVCLLLGIAGIAAYVTISGSSRSGVEVVSTVVVPAEGDHVLFADDFTTDINGWDTGEFEDTYGLEEIVIEDGVYSLSVTPKDAVYVERLLPERTFSDFVLTVEATPQDNETHYSYGVVFRANDLSSYAFEVGNDGLYGVFLYTDEWQTLEDWSETEAIQVGQMNTLTIRADGSTLTFSVNGELLTTIEDSTLAGGQIGFLIETFDEGLPAAVTFDNLVITALD